VKRVLIIVAIFALGITGIYFVSNLGSEKDNGDEMTMTDGGGGDEKKSEYKLITPEKAKEMMRESESFILLDVRTEEEYAEERIEGAKLIPDTEIDERVEKEIKDKDTLVFVYCRRGGRSASVAYKMVEMGYTNVYDMGGIVDWPYETIKGEK